MSGKKIINGLHEAIEHARGGRPSADILPFDAWKAVLRASPPSASGDLTEAAANERRVVEALAKRSREALDTLAEIPCDVEK